MALNNNNKLVSHEVKTLDLNIVKLSVKPTGTATPGEISSILYRSSVRDSRPFWWEFTRVISPCLPSQACHVRFGKPIKCHVKIGEYGDMRQAVSHLPADFKITRFRLLLCTA